MVAELPPAERDRVDHPFRDDVNFVNAMLDFVGANYSVAADRFFATGFSNGAAFTSRLAAELADRFAAVAAASGALQSTDEQTVAGARVARFTYAASNSGSGNRLEVLVIEGLGHSYPNGTNHPLIIANYLWEFFESQSLN